MSYINIYLFLNIFDKTIKLRIKFELSHRIRHTRSQNRLNTNRNKLNAQSKKHTNI